MYVCTYVYKQIYQEMSSYTRLPHLGQETFLAPSADKQTRNYYTE